MKLRCSYDRGPELVAGLLCKKIQIYQKIADAIQIDDEEGYVEYYTEFKIGLKEKGTAPMRGFGSIFMPFAFKRERISFVGLQTFVSGGDQGNNYIMPYVELKGTFGSIKFIFGSNNDREFFLCNLKVATEKFNSNFQRKQGSINVKID